MAEARDRRIDALRGAAALSVLLLHVLHAWYLGVGSDAPIESRLRQTEHWLGIVTLPLSFGFLGVNLFFLLSGLCIHAWFLGERERRREFSAKAYAVRRFWRIYPAYLACLAFSLLCLAIAEGLRIAFGAAETSAFAIGVAEKTLRYLVFAHTLTVESFGGYNPPLYTMAIEVQFYALYPLVLWAFHRFGPWLVLAASVILSAATTVYLVLLGNAELSRLVMDSFLVRWPEWIAGCVFAEIWHRQRAGAPGLRWPIATAVAASLFCLALALYVQVRHNLTLNLLWTSGLAVLLPVYLGPASSGRFWWEHKLADVGLYSYSLYLLHWPILRIAAILIPVSGELLLRNMLIYSLIVIVILSIAKSFYYCFERPFMSEKFRRRYAREAR